MQLACQSRDETPEPHCIPADVFQGSLRILDCEASSVMQHLRNFRILLSLGGGKIVKTAAAIIGSLYTAPEIRIVMNYASYSTP